MPNFLEIQGKRGELYLIAKSGLKCGVVDLG
jgi:hypothetical protein